MKTMKTNASLSTVNCHRMPFTSVMDWHNKRLVALGIVAVLALATTTLVTAQGGNQGNPNVMPPQSHAFGKTYAQWSAKWWQWALSLPVDQNPFFDETGCANGANGQSGPVWFLTGVINVSGTAVRDCTVPVGKALFVPIINVECSTLEPPPFHGDNEAELRACATSFPFADVFAEIDGVPVQNLGRYLVQSPLFTFTVPANNVLGVPAGTGQSVANGYYLMLHPLSAGAHVIHFGGTFSSFGFSLDITYHLTVQ